MSKPYPSNGGPDLMDDDEQTDAFRVTSDELRQFVERIERLEEDKKEVMTDIKEVYAEAKGRGYDPKVLRAVIAQRKKDPQEVSEFEAIRELYIDALGM